MRTYLIVGHLRVLPKNPAIPYGNTDQTPFLVGFGACGEVECL